MTSERERERESVCHREKKTHTCQMFEKGEVRKETIYIDSQIQNTERERSFVLVRDQSKREEGRRGEGGRMTFCLFLFYIVFVPKKRTRSDFGYDFLPRISFVVRFSF